MTVKDETHWAVKQLRKTICVVTTLVFSVALRQSHLYESHIAVAADLAEFTSAQEVELLQQKEK